MPPKSSEKSWNAAARNAFGYLVALGGLAWVLHDTNWDDLRKSMTGIHWVWVVPALLFDVLSYLCQGWRWQVLLKPLGAISVLRTTQAIYIGLFINEILPMRLGEVARPFLVARWMRKDFSSILPSMAVERLQDAVWLAAFFGLVAILVPMPPYLLDAADLLGVLTLAAVATFVVVVMRPGAAQDQEARSAAASRGFSGRLSRWLATFTQGVRQIGFSSALYISLGSSFFLLLFQGLAFWILMPACGLKAGFWVGMVVFLIVHVGTAIPNAPANMGSYQFFTVLGLTLFGEDKIAATAFSLIAFFLLTLPLWLIGLLALLRSGSTLKGLREEIALLSK